MSTEKIKYTDNLKQGTDKLNSAIEAANTAETLSTNADQKATQALTNSESTQDQLDTIVINGDSSVEAAQARISVEGTTYTTLRDRLDNEYQSITADLAETKGDLGDILDSDKVSKQMTLSDTDVTTPLQTTLTDLATREIKYAYFDEDTEIQLNTALPQSEVLMIGKSKIGKKINHNAYYHIPDSRKVFDGNVNKNYCKFTQLKSAIVAARPINFTVWGDSISTNGDLLNVNTASVSATLESGPDTLNEGDTYTSFLYDLVGDSMKDKTLNFYNRAIGGTWMGEWNTLKTIGGVEKTWIEHIKDTAPDVLVIAFGMNHNTYDRARSVAYNIKQITDYVNANFTNKPDLIFVTSPRPTYQPQSFWGSFVEQTSREIAASAIRNAAQKYKAYLMDINRLSNLKRVGIDWMNPTFKEFNVEPYIDKVKTGGNYVFDSNQQRMNISKLTKDFVLKFTVSFSGQAATNDSLNITYNKTQETGFNNNQININPFVLGQNQSLFRSYAKIADFNNWTAEPSVTKIISPAESVFHLRIEKRGNKLEILREAFNGVPLGFILRDHIDVWDAIGDIRFTHNQTTAGFTTTISNFKMYEPVYEEYVPEVTEKMMWGSFNESDTGLKLPHGGNGVNHPSGLGIKKVYLPSVERFAEAIADVYRNS